MVTKEDIEKVLDRFLDKDKYFIVKIHNKGENIKVILDGYKNFSIDDCVRINRQLKDEFAGELDDYNVEVTSPGLTAPFEVIEQYEKYTGHKVEVLLKDGSKITGKLEEVAPDGIKIEEKKRIKTDKNKKKTIRETKAIKFEDIKSTKLIISI